MDCFTITPEGNQGFSAEMLQTNSEYIINLEGNQGFSAEMLHTNSWYIMDQEYKYILQDNLMRKTPYMRNGNTLANEMSH